ncbi:MAG TPA: hypothetical protein VNK04_22330 [Gemmataceae bacterium]|nr:hypothetical protein [Gemmataceae bacterium]
MQYRLPSLAVLALVSCGPSVRADAFDRYTNPILAKVPAAEGVKEVKQLTADLLFEHDRVLPGVPGAFVVVQTNDGRYAKLLLQPARQKINAERSIPILIIERFVTYREGDERTVRASGQNTYLFPGFRFSLDLGQIVPEELAADLHFVARGEEFHVAPVGKAKVYLVTKPLPEAAPKKPARPEIGAIFEPRYFNGTFKLYDDGRRSGTLVLKVEENGQVTGSYYSDRDGRKYEVNGKIAVPPHKITFTVKFPRTEQTFQGWLFTGDGKYLTGSSRLLDREAGFYAVRVEEE